jgi:hypothetical protein
MPHNFQSRTKFKTAQKIPDTLVPVRKDDWLLITVPNYWGKGASIEEAKAALKGQYGNLTGREAPYAWHVYSVHKDSYVSGLGGLVFPNGHPPMLTASTQWPLE